MSGAKSFGILIDGGGGMPPAAQHNRRDRVIAVIGRPENPDS